MFWLYIAAGTLVTASLLPQSRERVKDVQWMPVAVAVGLAVLGESVKSIGTQSMQQF